MNKGILIFTLLILAMFSVSGIYAADANETLMASEDAATIEVAQSDAIIASDGNQAIEQSDDGTVNAETDLEILTAGEGNYSDLRNDIINGGNLTKSYYKYAEGDGSTIEIGTPNKVINGNGAIIDMAGSTIRAFIVDTEGVTIKNLTIKNTNYNGDGGTIYFNQSGSVINCIFTDNQARYYGGAVYFKNKGDVTNCNFTNNKAYHGGAVYFSSSATVTNCNFTNNKATDTNGRGGAIYFDQSCAVENCNFINRVLELLEEI